MMSNIENYIGNTPLVLIEEIKSNKIYAKLEGNNPAGSIKDRPAIRMIKDAELKGLISKGDTLIEATSGNTGKRTKKLLTSYQPWVQREL